MNNTALDNSNNSKFSKVKGEFKRFFSIFVLPTENEEEDSLQAIKATTQNKEDIAIIEELEKSQSELDKEAISFFEATNKTKKQSKQAETIKIESKNSIGKITKIETINKGIEKER